MKKLFIGLSLLACGAAATAAVNCVSFSPAGFVDAMQYDSGFRATWLNYDAAGSNGKQTKARFRKGTTVCDAAKECNPSAAYGWESLNWTFNKTASTGTLVGVSGGTPITLLQDMPVAITAGACSISAATGGVSTLSR